MIGNIPIPVWLALQQATLSSVNAATEASASQASGDSIRILDILLRISIIIGMLAVAFVIVAMGIEYLRDSRTTWNRSPYRETKDRTKTWAIVSVVCLILNLGLVLYIALR